MNTKSLIAAEAAGLDIDNFKTIGSIYVEPGTVIAIVEAGIKIASMFGRKRSDNEAELKYLRKIYREILDMQRDLDTIMRLLKDLKVYIDQSKIELIANTLRTKILRSNLTLTGYLENKTGNIEQELIEMFETRQLLGLYGFAHIHVYLLAFHMELELCYHCGKGKHYVMSLLDSSRKYFMDALDATSRVESPARRLAFISKEMKEMETTFVPNSFTEDVKVKIKRSGGCGEDGYKITRYTLNIQGNLKDGFTFSESEKIIKKVDPYHEHCDIHSPKSNATNYLETLAESLEDKALVTTSLKAIRKKYQDAHELYLAYMKSQMELTAVIKTIRDILEKMDEIEQEDTVVNVLEATNGHQA